MYLEASIEPLGLRRVPRRLIAMVIHTDPGVGLDTGADVLEGRPERVSRSSGVLGVAFATVTTLFALAAAGLVGPASPTAPRSLQSATPLVSTPFDAEAGGRHVLPRGAQSCVDAQHRALVANATRRGRSVGLESGLRWCSREWAGVAQNGRTRPEGVRTSVAGRTDLLVERRI
jgi:hypothetical protein